MVKRFVLCLFIIGLASSGLWAAIPKMKNAKEQIKEARAEIKKLRGLEKEERAAQQRRAIEAFKGVIENFPHAKKEVARAHLEIGDLYRKLKEKEKAEQAYMKVLGFPDEKSPVAEALLSLARFRFKEKDYEKAMARLEQLLKECAKRNAQCGEGLLLWGKCLLEKGRLDEMRKVLLRVPREYSLSSVRVIKAYDLIAQSYIREGLLARARKAIEECRDVLLKGVAEEKERTARILRVEKMKAIRLLEKAMEEASSKELKENEQS